MPRTVLLTFLLLLSSCSQRVAQTPETPYHPLPWEYDGTYRWTGEANVSDVHVRWEEFHKEGNLAIAEGAAIYISPWKQRTLIRVRASINLEEKTIEIWESEPSQPNFVTDGSHKGSLSDDLKTIETTWTTKSVGKAKGATGHLVLQANEESAPSFEPE